MTNQFSSSRYPHADGGHAMNGVCLFFVHFSFCSFFVIASFQLHFEFHIFFFLFVSNLALKVKYVINLLFLILEMQLELQNLYLYM